MLDLSGQKVGQYELRERLGRGGMAEVYKAYHTGMDRFVAIKIMLGHLAGDEQFVERFKREAQIVGRLRHPHIVQVFDFGVENEMYYMVMEYIRGRNLKSHIIKEKRMSADDALYITSQIADALDYAHQNGMIHRDLKPANIMFLNNDKLDVVLTDFGIARILGQSGITMSGMMIGTPDYISPEAASGENTDERSDLYGLGIILFEMLTGRVPYSADTPLATVLQHVHAPLPSTKGFNIPENIEQIILKAMSKEASERYQTAADFKAAVDAARATLGDMAVATVAPDDTPQTPSRDTTIDMRDLVEAEVAAENGAKVVAQANTVDDMTQEAASRRTESLNAQTDSMVDTMPDAKNPFGMAIGLVAIIAVVLIVGGLIISQINNNNTQAAIIPTSTPAQQATALAIVPSETPPIADADLSTALPASESNNVRALPSAQPTATIIAPTETATALSVADLATQLPASQPPDVTQPTVVMPTIPTIAPREITEPRPLLPLNEAMLLTGRSPFFDEIDRYIITNQIEQAFDLVEQRLDENDEDVDALIAHAFLLAWSDEGAAAENEARQALDIEPEAVDAHLAMSDALYFWPNHDYEGSLASAQRALELEPDNADAMWRIARAQGDLGDYEATGFWLDEAIAKGANGFRFVDFAAQQLFNNGLYEQAIPYLEAINSARIPFIPYEDPAAYLMAAWIQTGRTDDAYELAQQVSSSFELPYYLLDLAYVAWRAGDYAQAREWAMVGLQDDRDAEATNKARYVLALIERSEGNYEAALQYLTTVDTSQFDGWPFLTEEFGHQILADEARVHMDMGDYDEALTIYDRLIRRNDWEWPYYEERGQVHEQLGNTNAALEDYQQAFFIHIDGLYPDEIEPNWETRNRLRQQIVNLVWGDGATAVDLPPPSSPEEWGLSVPVVSNWSERQNAIEERYYLDDYAEDALLMAKRAYEANPDDIDALLAYGLAMVKADEIETATRLAERAIEMSDDDPRPYWLLADIQHHWSIQNPTAALSYAQQAADIAPDHPATAWRLGLALWSLNRESEATAQFEQAEGATGANYAIAAGLFWFESGEYQRAIPLLRTAAFSDYYPYNAGRLLQALVINGQAADARDISLQLIKYLDNDPTFYQDAAYAAFEAGDYELARHYTQISAAFYPDERFGTNYLLGLIAWYGDNDYETAIDILDPLRDDSESWAFFMGHPFNRILERDIAQIMIEAGEPRQALELYSYLVSEYGYDAEIRAERAELMVLVDDIERAIAEYGNAIAVSSDDEQRARFEARIAELEALQTDE